jgi:hypothetical protein
MIERKQKRIAERSAGNHRVAVDAVVADALPRSGKQGDIGSLGEPLGVAVNGEPLPVRDARACVFELRGVDAGSREQVSDCPTRFCVGASGSSEIGVTSLIGFMAPPCCLARIDVPESAVSAVLAVFDIIIGVA